MECLEFRRLLGSDPRVADREARDHARNCPACSDAQARASSFEGLIAEALAVPVPDGLAERILLAQLTGARQRVRRSWRRNTAWAALALAACMALAVGIVRSPSVEATQLSTLVVAHINGVERGALEKRSPVAAAAVVGAFADRGVRLQSVPTGISYVHECPVGDYKTVHMVMPEKDAPVSVLYVADHRSDTTRNVKGTAMRTREVPLGDGTLVLAANSDRHFDAIERVWRDAIVGPAQVAAGSL